MAESWGRAADTKFQNFCSYQATKELAANIRLSPTVKRDLLNSMAKRAMAYLTYFKLLPIILLQRKMGKSFRVKDRQIMHFFVNCIVVE